MSKQKHAIEFEKIINDGRERKRNEELAARIFTTKDTQRRASAPFKAGGGSSLASRVGVNKRVSSGARVPVGNINGDWTHDLHHTQNGRRPTAQQPALNSLAARVHLPGTAPPRARLNAQNTRSNRTTKLANAFSRTAASSSTTQQMNVVDARQGRGITIKGLAGPFAVLAQNFAPGTTAADIESALTPVGGLINSCRLVKTHPIVIAEIVFESKEGADRVIERFDQQTADGRTLSVYMKPGGYIAPPTGPRFQHANETRLGGNSVLVDGSMGFDDVMETDDAGRNLYSDKLVSVNQAKGNDDASYRRDRSFRQGR
ncbi:putative pentatricopeptide repeat protein [Rosellinia necatrix]|uniref:Putative pentatricopeptide repeat protein n=1 Tax=Rosellinia necatrix TaxID=77044 RepID=A0A1W2TLK5_ROSNE|nr:putative pentatricopeptide repeat protein [Rosellinia necatrix]